jgi:hypothetical protein
VPGWKTGLLIRRKKGRPHQFEPCRIFRRLIGLDSTLPSA